MFKRLSLIVWQFSQWLLTGISLSFTDIVKNRTPNNICSKINTLLNESDIRIKENNLDNHLAEVPYPQKHIWLSEKIDDKGCNYNVCFTIRLKGKERLDITKLSDAICLTLKNNIIYNINLILDENLLIAVENLVEPEVIIEEQLNVFSQEEIESIVGETIFKLEEGRLYKIILRKSQIMFIMHHAIIDQASIQLFWEEVVQRYQGIDILRKDCDYYSCFNSKEMYSKNQKLGEKFWKDEYVDFDPDSISFDSLMRPNRYERHRIRLPKGNISKLNENEIIAFFLALYHQVLFEQRGDENKQEFIIGLPYTNRVQANQAKVQGFFVNLLPFRIRGNILDFEKKVNQIKDKLLDVSLYQDIPYEQILGNIEFRSFIQKNAFLQNAFVYQNELKLLNLDEEIECKFEELHLGIPMFELTLYITNSELCYEILVEQGRQNSRCNVREFVRLFEERYYECIRIYE